MALRDVAGGAARMSAGFWTEVAKAVNPPPRPEKAAPIDPTPAPAVATASKDPSDAKPEGVLVPLDTWTRVLDQLGHLHEAGRELAEARERAGRAETQVEFLREQLAQARSKPKRRPPAPKPAAEATPPSPTASSEPVPARVIDLRTGTRTRVANARNRVGRWISSS